MNPNRASRGLAAALLLLLGLTSGVPAASASTPVDPQTLTPPPPPEFNPVCRAVGGGTICDLAFTEEPIVGEPSGIVCGGTELLVSQTRSVVGKRYYDRAGLLVRRHFHEDITGSFFNPDTGRTAQFVLGATNLHDLVVPGDVASGATQSSVNMRIYLPEGGTVLHDVGHTVFDEATGTILAQHGQHPFDDYFVRGDTAAFDALCEALAV
jgi:hypothetical protein